MTPAWGVRGQAILAAALVLALSACRGGDSAAGDSQNGAVVDAPTATETETGADLELVGSEVEGGDDYGFAFAGDDVGTPGPTLTVTAGAEVTIRFENVSDEQNHDFVVVQDRYGTFFEFEPLWGAETSTLTPGRSETISFTPDAAGTYAYVCTIMGHAGNGMHGEFTVEDASTAAERHQRSVTEPNPGLAPGSMAGVDLMGN